MATVELRREGGIAYREAIPDEPPAGDPVMLIHGYPQSSYMWRFLLPALADAGQHAIAPDLMGFGDSELDPPGTWEHHVEVLERFRLAVGLERVVLVVHDWGGLIGLRWACEHPDAVSALVLSNTGFFADGHWHGLAAAMRTEGQGERLLETLNRDAFAAMLHDMSTSFDDDALTEYWKAYDGPERRRAHLELYRSGDFDKLEPYQARFVQLEAPALILWGKDDEFAPVTGAYRFEEELPDTRLVIVEDAGHFVFEDEPELCASEVGSFLESLRR